MTTNLHDKMLAAIDALFSASDGDERDQAEEQLLDVRDEILKHKRAEQPAQRPTNCRHCGGAHNVICAGQCKEQPRAEGTLAQQEPVAYLVTGPYEKRTFPNLDSANAYCSGLNKGWGEKVYTVNPLYTTPQAQTRSEATLAREWVGLTDEDKEFIELTGGKSDVLLAELVETKLKEKNT